MATWGIELHPLAEKRRFERPTSDFESDALPDNPRLSARAVS
jgi:hypothetical protein